MSIESAERSEPKSLAELFPERIAPFGANAHAGEIAWALVDVLRDAAQLEAGGFVVTRPSSTVMPPGLSVWSTFELTAVAHFFLRACRAPGPRRDNAQP